VRTGFWWWAEFVMAAGSAAGLIDAIVHGAVIATILLTAWLLLACVVIGIELRR